MTSLRHPGRPQPWSLQIELTALQVVSGSTSARQVPEECLWFLDGFSVRALLPVGLWRYELAIQYVVGRVATWPAFSPRCRKERDGWVPLRAGSTWPRSSAVPGRGTRYAEFCWILGFWSATRNTSSKRRPSGIGWAQRGSITGFIAFPFEMNGFWLSSATLRVVGLNNADWYSWLPISRRWPREVRVDEAMARPWTCQSERSVKQHLTVLRIAVVQSGTAPVIVDKYGRVHSPVTNLRRAVRPALRIQGQALAEVDVSNAQPLLLGFIVAKLLAGDWSLKQVKRLGSARELRDPFHGHGVHTLVDRFPSGPARLLRDMPAR